jgi:predicted MFS family arabinose efflux permease
MNIKSTNLERADREDKIPHWSKSAKMTAATVSLGTASPAPSSVSLSGLDGVNFLAGFGPYVAAYLAEQKWTQENIGFVLTASGLAGLLSQLPGAELLDTVRSKRALVVAGAAMVAISAIIIAFQPSFPLVFSGLVCCKESRAGSSDRQSLRLASA